MYVEYDSEYVLHVSEVWDDRESNTAESDQGADLEKRGCVARGRGTGLPVEWRACGRERGVDVAGGSWST